MPGQGTVNREGTIACSRVVDSVGLSSAVEVEANWFLPPLVRQRNSSSLQAS